MVVNIAKPSIVVDALVGFCRTVAVPSMGWVILGLVLIIGVVIIGLVTSLCVVVISIKDFKDVVVLATFDDPKNVESFIVLLLMVFKVGLKFVCSFCVLSFIFVIVFVAFVVVAELEGFRDEIKGRVTD